MSIFSDLYTFTANSTEGQIPKFSEKKGLREKNTKEHKEYCKNYMYQVSIQSEDEVKKSIKMKKLRKSTFKYFLSGVSLKVTLGICR